MAWVAIDRAGHTSADFEAPHALRGKSLTVVSLNMAKETRVDEIVRQLDQYPALRDADIFLMQEVTKIKSSEPSVAEEVAKRWNRKVVFASPDALPTTLGLAILSRSPLRETLVQPLRKNNLVFRTRPRIALSATVDSPFGPLRVVDAHLDTRINPQLRAEQLEPVIREAERFSGAAVVGGDFNTNDMVWFAAVLPMPAPGRQARAMRKMMTSHGFNTPFGGATGATFDHFGMQLDWIYTNRLRAVSASVQPVEFSDHHAIRVEYALRQ